MCQNKINKTVRVLSSRYLDDSLPNKDHKKPNMIHEYNRTKGRVDNADKLMREYSSARRPWRWPLQLFMNMLVIGALKSYVIWMYKNKAWYSRKSDLKCHFLTELGKN